MPTGYSARQIANLEFLALFLISLVLLVCTVSCVFWVLLPDFTLVPACPFLLPDCLIGSLAPSASRPLSSDSWLLACGLAITHVPGLYSYSCLLQNPLASHISLDPCLLFLTHHGLWFYPGWLPTSQTLIDLSLLTWLLLLPWLLALVWTVASLTPSTDPQYWPIPWTESC